MIGGFELASIFAWASAICCCCSCIEPCCYRSSAAFCCNLIHCWLCYDLGSLGWVKQTGLDSLRILQVIRAYNLTELVRVGIWALMRSALYLDLKTGYKRKSSDIG